MRCLPLAATFRQSERAKRWGRQDERTARDGYVAVREPGPLGVIERLSCAASRSSEFPCFSVAGHLALARPGDRRGSRRSSAAARSQAFRCINRGPTTTPAPLPTVIRPWSSGGRAHLGTGERVARTRRSGRPRRIVCMTNPEALVEAWNDQRKSEFGRCARCTCSRTASR